MAALIAGIVGCVDITRDVEIRTWYELDAIRNNLDGSYILINDLDSTTAGYEELAGPNGNEGMGWLPIGTEDNPFTGSLDGQGYEIRDLIMYASGLSHVGVFSFVGEGGQIEDIGVGDAEVIGDEVAGCLVAVCYGTVTNSYSIASVYGHDYAGGLVGENHGTVTDSYFKGSVTSDAVAGGLVGINEGIVSNSYATGNVTGGWLCVGGLVGGNAGTVTNSYSSCDVSGDVIEGFGVGGLVGWNGGDSFPGTVSNSYSTGSVTGEDDVGGLVGVNVGAVSNSYSTGNVTGEADVGGLVGANYGTVSNSFWDRQTSGQSTSDGGTRKTTAQMQNIATFTDAGWNITTVANPGTHNPSYIWNIVNGVTYPFLSWQPV